MYLARGVPWAAIETMTAGELGLIVEGISEAREADASAAATARGLAEAERVPLRGDVG